MMAQIRDKLKKEDTYNKAKETDEVTTWKSKCSCFDADFFTDIVARLVSRLLNIGILRYKNLMGKYLRRKERSNKQLVFIKERI